VCKPALLAHGFISNSPAPADPCLSGLPAIEEAMNPQNIKNVKYFFTLISFDIFQSLLKNKSKLIVFDKASGF
jgi:hypothetical protein